MRGLLVGVMLLAANPVPSEPESVEAAQPADETPVELADPAPYQEVLLKFVDDGRVDYAALKKDRARLDEYLKNVASVGKKEFESSSKEAQVAYLLNAYNAYTLEAIIDHYPIKKTSGFLGGLLRNAPDNSIKQIPGVWDETRHQTALGKLTLDQIEHERLRKDYDMPLVHMGLVCASKGCPPLPKEPFRAEGLKTQLEERARVYLASKHGLRVDGKRVMVSEIFKWFAKDFANHGGVKGFVERYAPESKRAAVKAANGRFGYIDYDWTLNDKEV